MFILPYFFNFKFFFETTLKNIPYVHILNYIILVIERNKLTFLLKRFYPCFVSVKFMDEKTLTYIHEDMHCYFKNTFLFYKYYSKRFL